MDRREFLQLIGATGAAALTASCNRFNSVSGVLSSPANLVRFPEKTEMILLTDRPPQLETPIHYFRQDLTPNEAFFVRWHLEGIPTSVDLRTFRLNVSGHVRKPLQLSVDDLRSHFEPVSIIAVNQCSSNSRSFFEPRVPGGQWKNGAVGNAKWTGVSVKSILDRAQVKAGAVDVSFNGLDVPPLPSVSDFVKALSIDHARNGEVMIAYAMNDHSLPVVNGFRPCRGRRHCWWFRCWCSAPYSPGGERLEMDVLAERRSLNQCELCSLLCKCVRHGIGVAAHHGDRNTRILAQKPSNQARQQILADGLRGAEGKLPPGFSADIGHHGLRFVREGLEFLGVGQKRLSSKSHGDPPSGAIE
jgi:DMSO/TMAO reductase YedYZ molybdopterin-dependent catalytic subunit